MNGTVEILLARAPGTIRFDHRIAKRLIGQRIRLEGVEVATVESARVLAGGREVWGVVDFDHTAVGEAARSTATSAPTSVQGALFDLPS